MKRSLRVDECMRSWPRLTAEAQRTVLADYVRCNVVGVVSADSLVRAVCATAPADFCAEHPHPFAFW